MHQKETRSMFQSGREITGEELEEIQETVRSFPTLSLSELAQTICEHLGWFTASGGYKTDACLKLLSRLEGKGFLRLPAKRAISPGRRGYRIGAPTPTERSVRISRTTLFRICLTAQLMIS
ncbi:MAG: hypothetical protein JRF35_15880, partial [Deltaproteobacteria bacterium]|nr:hypothetical protein [Deltaproteobacteria bacterium]